MAANKDTVSVIAVIVATMLATASLTWIVFVYTFDSNRIATYEATEKELKLRIDVLEKDISNIKSINQIYVDCISADPGLTVNLQRKVEQLIAERQLVDSVILKNPQSTQRSENNDKSSHQPLSMIRRINQYESSNFAPLNLVVGVTDISLDREVSLTITHNSQTKDIRCKAGYVWDFSQKDMSYRLILKTVDYVSGYIKVELSELRPE